MAPRQFVATAQAYPAGRVLRRIAQRQAVEIHGLHQRLSSLLEVRRKLMNSKETAHDEFVGFC
jgi:hypothetical protein